MTDTAKAQLKLWVEELHQDTLGLRYRVRRTLFSGESDFQNIDVVETAGYGKMLLNDSVVMLTERDERIYHEMIVHPAMLVYPDIRRALVIGGGDGGTVRELLRHPSIEQVHLVEIDPLVLEACRKHIPQTSAALDDARVRVSVEDGVRYVAQTDRRYDLVIVDSTDPIGPATPLFGAEFYGNVARVLTDRGTVVSQAESPFYQMAMQQKLTGILGRAFDRVYLYNYTNLSYPGGLWSFTLASKSDRCPIADFDAERAARLEGEMFYYTPELHRACFTLPAFQRDALADRIHRVG